MTRIDWDLVTRYLAGTCTPAEREWTERMSAAHGEISLALAAARDVAHDGDAEVSEDRLAVCLAAVKRDGERGGRERVAAPDFTLPGSRRSLLAIAATVALVAGGVAGGWVALGRPSPTSPVRAASSVIATAPGQRLSLRLSDGTLVSLAPATTLRTPADYGRSERTVELEGEALFTVTHDAARPFTVRTPRAVATDLGTRFAVRAYADDPATDIVVAEGRVAVRQTIASDSLLPTDSIILGRRERARVTAEGGLELSRNVALEDYLDWAEGRLAFRGRPLREVAKRLARWYDVEIRLEPAALGDRRIFATVKDEPIVDVLHSIAASFDLRLSRADRVFTLSVNRPTR